MEALTRQEVLQFLCSLGIELPPATKLPDSALNERLDQAIKSCEELVSERALHKLKLSSLRDWPSGRLKVAPAMMRLNAEEFSRQSIFNTELRDRALQLLSCLRHILIGFADSWDKGSKAFFIDDPDNPQSLHIALRVYHSSLPYYWILNNLW